MFRRIITGTALISLLFLIFGAISFAQEETFESITGNKYFGGESYSVNKDVDGDLAAAGGSISIDANVEDNLFLVGGDVEYKGDVSDDIFAAGGAVLIDEGTVNGDINVAGGYVVINADVEGDIRVTGGEVYINSKNIGGDLLAGGGTVSISRETVVDGDLNIDAENTTESASNNPTDLSDADSSMYYNMANMFSGTRGRDNVDLEIPVGLIVVGGLIWGIFNLLATFILGYSLMRLFPTFSEKTLETMQKNLIGSILAGFITFVLAPIVFTLLMITFFGYKLAIAFVLLGILALYLAGIYAKYTIGRLLLKRMERKNTGRALPLLTGLIIVDLGLGIIGLVPILGWLTVGLINFVLTSWGVGAIAYNKYKSLSA